MAVNQVEISLPPFERGFHIITSIIENAIELPKTGVLNIFIKHTSAALTINENTDPSVRVDFESIINKIVPENQSYYTHVFEGADDMPAHVKTSLFDTSINIPIKNHQLNLGIWQGIYFCEFRNSGGSRKICITTYA